MRSGTITPTSLARQWSQWEQLFLLVFAVASLCVVGASEVAPSFEMFQNVSQTQLFQPTNKVGANINARAQVGVPSHTPALAMLNKTIEQNTNTNGDNSNGDVDDEDAQDGNLEAWSVHLRRALKISEKGCESACATSARVAQKAHLRGKVPIEICDADGKEHTTTCCLCIKQGFKPQEIPVESKLDLSVGKEGNIASGDGDLAAARLEIEALRAQLKMAVQQIQPHPGSNSVAAVAAGSSNGVEVDIDVASLPVTCETLNPKQIFYNRIGKAGSTSVAFAFKSAAQRNGFKMKDLITSEYLTKQG